MDDLIRVQDSYYILATSALADDRTRVLKDADTFGVFDRFGDILPIGARQQGLFHDGTRYLSRLELRVNGVRPLLLGSTVEQDNAALVAALANPDVSVDGLVVVPRNTIFIERTSFLLDGTCYTRLGFRNFDTAPLDLTLDLLFEADFADIFEVRGLQRARRGTLIAPAVSGDGVVLAYDGLDGVRRRTSLGFTPAPASLAATQARLAIHLLPGGEARTDVTIECAFGPAPSRRRPLEEAAHTARARLAQAFGHGCGVRTSNPRFDDWLARSAADLAMMLTETPLGLYPYAGVPWFSTPFGRDGIITALQVLWLDPEIAKGVLRFLAATQATASSDEADAEPGKILHEMRGGEMAALGEIPFGRYYGSIDATPLYVLLAAAYFERTGDAALIRDLWPNITAALDWIDRYGDIDGDGFVEYARRSGRGLRQQGWKDSEDSVFHADGTLADAPIALCEVQGYAYAAKRGAARLAALLGDDDRAERLQREATALRHRFDTAFWCDDLGAYALALDGAKRPCRVRTSNAGQCLFTGIASPERARRLGTTLLAPDMASGWGIRTLATGAPRYNPMSYHNGSVWPHDNSLIAAGLSAYGLETAAEATLRGLFDACLAIDLQRLPELFCGFPRRPGSGPTLYPVACAPQAWASGAVYLLLASILGLGIEAVEHRVRFTRTRLPAFLHTVWIDGLQVGDAVLDVELRRHHDDVGVHVTRRAGSVEVLVVR